MASLSTASPSPQQSQPPSQHGDDSGAAALDSIPVEILVQHLLDAKRSLSSMERVLEANKYVTLARQAHEESVILGAQTQFLRRGISEQAQLLNRARRSMVRTHEFGKHDFKKIVKTLDAANDLLQATMDVLQHRIVESTFRPGNEERKTLLDFVDVAQVETMQKDVKENMDALQATQKSFDGDLLRFETDLRTLGKSLKWSSFLSSPSASNSNAPVDRILANMMASSHDMAELLASLTKHFDVCVTAVRSTEGGAALAKIKAAEDRQSQGGDEVSISGVIAEQESHMAELEPISPEERTQMLQVVVQDASEVPEVVRDINNRLQTIQENFERLHEQTNQVKTEYFTTLEAFHVLEDIGSKLQSYIAAEREFVDQWHTERQTLDGKLTEMEQLRVFYNRYAGTYDRLLLEADRRRAQEEKVRNIWKKAKESVNKVVEADRQQREAFRQEVAEYIPTDLWPGMDDGMRQWDVVQFQDDAGAGGGAGSTPALDRRVIQEAAMRLRGHDSER